MKQSQIGTQVQENCHFLLALSVVTISMDISIFRQESQELFLTLKGSGGALLCPPLSKSNALDLWLGPHLQNIYDYSN